MTHSIHITNTQLTHGHVPTQKSHGQWDSAAARGLVPRPHVTSATVSVLLGMDMYTHDTQHAIPVGQLCAGANTYSMHRLRTSIYMLSHTYDTKLVQGILSSFAFVLCMCATHVIK
jgi:hypothetical protein